MKTHALRLPFAAVLFDLDGVLVDSGAVVDRHYRSFAHRHGLDADDFVQGVAGRRMMDVFGAAVPFLRGQQLLDECRRFEAAEADDIGDLVAVAGAAELVHALRDRPWAVVTSGTAPVAEARLAAVGLPTPEVFVTGDQVARGKPSPEPYLCAADALGVDPGRCIVVEDAPAGVQAGLAAGATVLGVTTTMTAESLAAAHHVIASLAQLRLEEGTAYDETLLGIYKP